MMEILTGLYLAGGLCMGVLLGSLSADEMTDEDPYLEVIYVLVWPLSFAIFVGTILGVVMGE